MSHLRSAGASAGKRVCQSRKRCRSRSKIAEPLETSTSTGSSIANCRVSSSTTASGTVVRHLSAAPAGSGRHGRGVSRARHATEARRRDQSERTRPMLMMGNGGAGFGRLKPFSFRRSACLVPGSSLVLGSSSVHRPWSVHLSLAHGPLRSAGPGTRAQDGPKTTERTQDQEPVTDGPLACYTDVKPWLNRPRA